MLLERQYEASENNLCLNFKAKDGFWCILLFSHSSNLGKKLPLSQLSE